MYDFEWYLTILVCTASFLWVSGETQVDGITAPWTAIFVLYLQKEHLCRKKWQSGENFVLQFNIEVISDIQLKISFSDYK